MDAKEFGQLLKALREETVDDNGHPLSQRRLSEITLLNKRTIEEIEAGNARRLTDHLDLLATALKLTTVERKEFFLAALSVSTRQLASQDSRPNEALNDLLDIMEVTGLPAYMVNSFGDIVAANASVMRFFGIPTNTPPALADGNAPYSLMRLLLSPEANLRAIFGDQWERVAVDTTQFFRGITLRYRGSAAFKARFDTLKRLEGFWHYWRARPVDGGDNYGDIDAHEYRHPVYGKVSYILTVSPVFTSAGELYLTLLTPTDPHTRRVFEQLHQQGQKIELFAPPWPAGTQGTAQDGAAEPASSTFEIVVNPQRIQPPGTMTPPPAGNIIIKRIVDHNDPDLPPTLALYARTIPENEREPEGEIVRYLAESPAMARRVENPLEELLVVAKVGKTVVAYLYGTYYLQRGYLFINYLGIDPALALTRDYAVASIMYGMRHLFRQELQHCRGILYEIDRPGDDLTPTQNRERRARRRLFRRYAREFGVDAYLLPFDFVQPILSLREGEHYEEEHLSLILVPIAPGIVTHDRVRKETMADILRLVYLDWYGDIYESVVEHRDKYRLYLQSLVTGYVEELPDELVLHT